MSDSQKFPVAAHALAYLEHKAAFSPDRAVACAELAASVPTNPVVVRRVTAMLSTRPVPGSMMTAPWANGLVRFSLARMCFIAYPWILGLREVTTR